MNELMFDWMKVKDRPFSYSICVNQVNLCRVVSCRVVSRRVVSRRVVSGFSSISSTVGVTSIGISVLSRTTTRSTVQEKNFFRFLRCNDNAKKTLIRHTHTHTLTATTAPHVEPSSFRDASRDKMDAESLEKLRLLKVALDEGLISVDEHAEQKRRLLDGLTTKTKTKTNEAPEARSPSTAGDATNAAKSPAQTPRANDGVALATKKTTNTNPAPPPPTTTTTMTTTTSLKSRRGGWWSGRRRDEKSGDRYRDDGVATSSFGTLLAGLTALIVYVSTMFPSAAGGDATELAFIACDAAVPHPPGYPTFTMMASTASRLLAKIPLINVSPAYGANLASSVAAAVAAAALYAAIHTAVTAAGIFPMKNGDGDGDGGDDHAGDGDSDINTTAAAREGATAATAAGVGAEVGARNEGDGVGGRGRRVGDEGGGTYGAHAAAALGSGLFAFSRNVWMNSMQSEVFGLNNMFVALAILFAVRFGVKKLQQAATVADADADADDNDEEEEEKKKKNKKDRKKRKMRETTAAAVPGALREAVCGAFICGLAMTNQHTFVLFGTPLALWVLASGRDVGLWRPLPLAAMFIAPLVGLAPYAYLPYASGGSNAATADADDADRGGSGSGTSTPGAWGATHTLDGFMTHVLRKEYGTFRLYSGASRGDHRMWLGLRRYGANLMTETSGVALPLVMVAFLTALALLPLPRLPGGFLPEEEKKARMGRRRKGGGGGGGGKGTDTGSAVATVVPGLRPVVAAYLAYTVGFQYMANLPIEKELYLGVAARFWMQSDVAAGFIMGVGAALIIAWIAHLTTTTMTDQSMSSGISKMKSAGGGAGGKRSSEGGRGGRGRGGRGSGRGHGASGREGESGTHACDRHLREKNRAQVELAALGVAVSLLAARVSMNYSSMNERGNNMFEDFGREMLRPLPRNARLIVRGDLITNSARFVQRCLHYRRDVQMVDMAMMTYKWFVPVQGANFPSFTWPGTHYHPYETNGFSMKGLLDANFAADPNSPIFIAGGWHDEDFSQNGAYETRPYGIVDEIVRVGVAKPIKPRGFYKKVKTALPNITFPPEALVMDPTNHKYPEGRWERIVVKDYFQAHHKVAYTLLNWGLATSDRHTGMINSGQPPPAKETEDVVWAFERCVELIEWCLTAHPKPVPSFYYRNLGICYQRLWAVQPAKQEHHRAMIRAFRGYLEIGYADPTVRNEGGFDAVEQIVRKADQGGELVA